MKNLKRTCMVLMALMTVCVTKTMAQGEDVIVDLDQSFFKNWTTDDETAAPTGTVVGCAFELGKEIGGGTTVYGDGSVGYLNYADISEYDELQIEATAGLQLRVMYNRKGNEGPLKENNYTVGESGKVIINLEGCKVDGNNDEVTFVHLNSIKTNWGSPNGTVTSIKLIKKAASTVDPDAIFLTNLDATLYQSWTTPGADAVVTGLGAGGVVNLNTPLVQGNVVWGDGSGYVPDNNFADITDYDEIRLEGTPGGSFRFMYNRVETGSICEIPNAVIGENGKLVIKIKDIPHIADNNNDKKVDFIHLQGIKMNWGTPETTITKLQLYRRAITVDGKKIFKLDTDVDNVDVVLNRVIKADVWNTFVVPFDITDAEAKAAFGDDVKVAEFSENSADADKVAVAFNIAGNAGIKAHTPVLLKTSAAGTTYKFADKSVKAVADAVVPGANFSFTGSYLATTKIAEGDYFISDDKVYRSAGETTIAGTRAYIKANDASANARIVRLVIGGNEVTAIDGVFVEKQADDALYNLAGQRVDSAKATKGLYIKNGKKVIIK